MVKGFSNPWIYVHPHQNNIKRNQIVIQNQAWVFVKEVPLLVAEVFFEVLYFPGGDFRFWRCETKQRALNNIHGMSSSTCQQRDVARPPHSDGFTVARVSVFPSMIPRPWRTVPPQRFLSAGSFLISNKHWFFSVNVKSMDFAILE